MGCGCGKKKVMSMTSVQLEQQRLADQQAQNEAVQAERAKSSVQRKTK